MSRLKQKRVPYSLSDVPVPVLVTEMKFRYRKRKILTMEKWCFSSPPLRIYVPVSPRYMKAISVVVIYCFCVVTSFSQHVDRGKQLFSQQGTARTMPSSLSSVPSDDFQSCSDLESLPGLSSDDIGEEVINYDDFVEPVVTEEEAADYLEQLALQEEEEEIGM